MALRILHGYGSLYPRRERGEQAINLHPDDIDRETAASDIVADILTALFGPAGAFDGEDGPLVLDEFAVNEARRFIERAMASYQGDAEDYVAHKREGE